MRLHILRDSWTVVSYHPSRATFRSKCGRLIEDPRAKIFRGEDCDLDRICLTCLRTHLGQRWFGLVASGAPLYLTTAPVWEGTSEKGEAPGAAFSEGLLGASPRKGETKS